MRISLFFYNWLSKKQAGWFAVLVATVVKSILTAVFSSFEGDKSYYLLLGKNIAAGHGFTVPITLLSNPSITDQVYIPSAVSPLYSILSVPLLWLFPDNFYIVTWIIESLSWLLLFIVLHRILSTLIADPFWPNLFIIFSGFYLYNIELSSSSKDVLATALIFLALFRCIQITQNKKNLFPYILVSSLIFILPGLTKFIYLPLALVFPFCILWIGFTSKQKKVLRVGAITFILSVVLVAMHYLYFHSLETDALSNHGDFFSNRWSLAKSGDDFVHGFFPENMLLMYPYIPAAFFNLDVIGVQVRSFIPSLYKMYGLMLSILNALGILILLVLFIYKCRQLYRSSISSRNSFFLCGTIISFSMLLLASALSMRYHTIEYKGGGSAWTYVFENRPFVFSIIFIQLLLFIFLFSSKVKSAFLLRLKPVIAIVLAIGFFHGVYFGLKSVVSPAQANQRPVSINKLVVDDADSIQKANPSAQVWIATEMQHLDWYAKLQHKKVFNRVAWLNDSSFRLPPKTILLTAITSEDTPQIRNYIKLPSTRQLRNYDDTWFVYLQSSD